MSGVQLPLIIEPGILWADFIQWHKQGEHDVQHPVYHRRDVRFR